MASKPPGSATHHDAAIGENAAPFPADPPVAYSGVLPCADCEGVRHDLLLFPDEVFYLRTAYLGKRTETVDRDEPTFHDIGRWVLSPKGEVISLHGYDGNTMLAVLSGTTPRMLDRQGRRFESTLDYA